MKYKRNDGTWGEYPHKLSLADLARLDKFLDSAGTVVPLKEVSRGSIKATEPIVAMRHDVDHNLDYAIKFAEWEHERGYRSTYFILHTAWYYEDKSDLREGILRLVELGHEVGFHSNATVLACREFDPRERWALPATRLSDAVTNRIAEITEAHLAELRSFGVEIVGSAPHGDIGCYQMGVYNDLRHTGLSLEQFGLEYDADGLRYGIPQLDDNHGVLRGSLNPIENLTFFLIHPCHWELP